MVGQATVAKTFGIVLTGLGVLGIAGVLPGRLQELTALHDLVHLVPGLALLWAGFWARTATRSVNVGVGAAYVLVGLAGPIAPDLVVDVLAITPLENGLHLLGGLTLVAAGLGLDPEPIRVPS